jgi:hypothetical protein
MVEGGAQIISAFFAAASETECVNTLLITTATLIVGAAGVGYDVPGVRWWFLSSDAMPTERLPRPTGIRGPPPGLPCVERRLVRRDSVVAFQTT